MFVSDSDRLGMSGRAGERESEMEAYAYKAEGESYKTLVSPKIS